MGEGMSREEFAGTYTKMLEEQYYEKKKVEIQQKVMQKVNGALDAWVIKFEDSKVAPVIYVDEQYDLYKQGHTVEELVSNVTRQFAEQMPKIFEEAENVHEYVAENVFAVVINAEENLDLLLTTPHELIEDLAVIPKYRFGDVGCCVISKDVCQMFHKTSDEIMEQALANAEKQNCVLKSMDDMMVDLMKVQGLPDDYIEEMMQLQGTDSMLYVLTNQSKTEGAAAILSKQALESAREKIGDFYILPSSRHEVLLVPKSKIDDVEYLRGLVREVNFVEVAKEDKLSDQVYSYDGLTKRITIAGNAPVKSPVASLELGKTHAKAH